jgi:hypothetical protein
MRTTSSLAPTIAAAALTGIILTAVPAYADQHTRDHAPRKTPASLRAASQTIGVEPAAQFGTYLHGRRASADAPLKPRAGASASPSVESRAGHRRSSRAARIGKRIALGSALGVAGFFGGGFLGAALEPDCHCDDPGLRGALIGAPIGATVGAVVGVSLVD